MPKDANGLTPRVAKFVAAMIAHGQAGQAAEDAGFSKKSAPQQASRLLKNAKVCELIASGQRKAADNAGITAQRVLEELALIAFSDMRQFAEWGPDGGRLQPSGEMTEAAARCVAEVAETTTKEGGSIRFKLHSKPEALTLLGKRLGLFVERIGDPDGKPLAAPTAQVWIFGKHKVAF